MTPELDLEEIKSYRAFRGLGRTRGWVVALTVAERDALVAEVERLRSILTDVVEWIERRDPNNVLDSQWLRDAIEAVHRA
jgi:hypothetical protein